MDAMGHICFGTGSPKRLREAVRVFWFFGEILYVRWRKLLEAFERFCKCFKCGSMIRYVVHN